MTAIHEPLEAGEFIRIPAWNIEGMVYQTSAAMFGSEHAIVVTLELYPDQPVEKMRRYRLEPGEYEVL